MDGKLRNMTSVYIIKNEKVLLLYRQGSRVVNNVWIGSAGGHFENYELNDAKACAIRELNEELGIGLDEVENIQLRYITIRRTHKEIRQNYYFFADLKDGVDDNLNSNEGTSKWFPFEEIYSLEMPYTARYVMEHYCATGKYTSEMYVGIANGDKVVFANLPEF